MCSSDLASFTEDIVRTMHAAVARPIILTLSNPTSKVEARPEQLLAWTNGAAIIGTGSPFAPVLHDGVTYHIGQCNNAFVFPGIGLAAGDDAERVEAQLCALLPAERWVLASDVLILHGRRVCRPTPLCDRCALKDTCAHHRGLGAPAPRRAPRRLRPSGR